MLSRPSIILHYQVWASLAATYHHKVRSESYLNGDGWSFAVCVFPSHNRWAWGGHAYCLMTECYDTFMAHCRPLVVQAGHPQQAKIAVLYRVLSH
jgi:hypothetical protein